MGKEDLGARLMDDIDPGLLDFIRSRVNTFIKWDLVRFFNDNPHTTDTAENIARYTGRDLESVLPELAGLVEVGILRATPLGGLTVFTLDADSETLKVIRAFITACEDRQFRIKAIYHVIRGLTDPHH